MKRYIRNLFVTSALLFHGSVIGLAGDKWTDSSGTKTIEADFVKLDGIQLTIKKSDGKEIVIPLYKLDNTSRLLARKLAKTPRSAATTGTTTSESESVATTSQSGLFSSVSSGVDIFPPNATAKEFFDIMIREVEKKNFAVAWDSLPMSHQQDVEQIIQLALTKVEQKTLDEISKFKKEVLSTLRAKKTMILNSKAIPIDGNMKPIVSQVYEPALDVLDAILSDDLLNLEKLKSSKPRAFIQEYSGRSMAKIEAMLKMLPFPGDPMEAIMAPAMAPMKSIQIKSVSDTEAIATMTTPNGPMEETYVKKEGKWISKKQWDNWATTKAEAEKMINSVEPKTIGLQVKQALAVVRIPIGVLTEAETQQDVDDILGDIVKQVQGATAGVGAGFMNSMAPRK